MHPYQDPSQPITARVEDLLSRMTTQEKVGQLLQINGQPQSCDALHLYAELQPGSILCLVGSQVELLQKAALASRLGIPLLFGIDAIHGHSMWPGATMFPSQLGQACAWDAELCRRSARATAVEMSATGVPWTFSPVFCLPRDLRWGRVNETFGEDPLLIAELGAAMVRGYQGDDLSRKDAVAACAKHFVGYGDTLGGRDASEAEHSRRKLRALFFPPFQAAVEAGVATFMTGYQSIDGTPCTASRWLLDEVLRGEWGFDGVVVTDWDNVGRMVREQRVAADFDQASRLALRAGNDLIMKTTEFVASTLRNLENGVVPMAEVDRSVRRILALKFRLGLFEDPRLPDERRAAELVGCQAHRELAREAARRSLVLLKNRNRLLPVDPRRLRSVAVIGPFADDALEQNGDWSLGAGQNQGQRERHPRPLTVTVRDGLERRLGPAVAVRYAEGCQLDQGWAAWDGRGFHTQRSGGDAGRIARAVDAARGADLAVVVLGDGITHTGEFKSTMTLELPGAQMELLRAVHAVGTPLVVVLQAGKPLAVPEAAELADAFLVQFTPGMEGGSALAELLVGDCEPEGRLPISFPYHVGQQPVAYNQTPGTHGEHAPDLGHAGFANPLFAFGEGLSYTTVQYRRLEIATPVLAAGQALQAVLHLANKGERPVVETVQWYLHDRVGSVTVPERRLVGWTKVALAPGQQAEVAFTLDPRRLALCDAEGRWVVEPGEFELQAGPSSRPGRLLKAAFRLASAG